MRVNDYAIQAMARDLNKCCASQLEIHEMEVRLLEWANQLEKPGISGEYNAVGRAIAIQLRQCIKGNV